MPVPDTGGDLMPLHDWRRLNAGIYHDFHTLWIGCIRRVMNAALPQDYYALAEQPVGSLVPDVLALHRRGGAGSFTANDSGGLAVAVRDVAGRARQPVSQRRVVIRHASGDRVVAIIELVSWGNKRTVALQNAFCRKLADVVQSGVHLLYVDPFAPPPGDDRTLHHVLWRRLGGRARHDLGTPSPGTVGSYEATTPPRCYVNPLPVGLPLPAMPVFLDDGASIALALDAAYAAAYADVLPMHKQILEANPS